MTTARPSIALSHSRPFVEPRPKPETNGSWWLLDQRPDQKDAWYARAAQELDRMAGSREARSLSPRRAIEELGWKGKDS